MVRKMTGPRSSVPAKKYIDCFAFERAVMTSPMPFAFFAWMANTRPRIASGAPITEAPQRTNASALSRRGIVVFTSVPMSGIAGPIADP